MVLSKACLGGWFTLAVGGAARRFVVHGGTAWSWGMYLSWGPVVLHIRVWGPRVRRAILLADAIATKVEKNRERPYRHGGKRC